MKVSSINETIRVTEGITDIRVDGSFIVLSYDATDVYYNDQGREVFAVENDPVPVQISNLLQRFCGVFSRLWRWLNNIKVTDYDRSI